MSESPAEQEQEEVTVISKIEVLHALDSQGEPCIFVTNTSESIIEALGLLDFARNHILQNYNTAADEE